MFAFGTKHEAVEPTRLTNGFETIETSGENFVDIGLMADVKENAVLWRVEDGVKSQGEFDDAEVGAKMAAGFRKGLDEEGSDLGGKHRHFLGVQSLEVGR